MIFLDEILSKGAKKFSPYNNVVVKLEICFEGNR
jgi:hypothetical protein